MFRNLLQLYSMVVCLFATLILMFTLVQVMQNVVALVLPEYKYNYDTAKFNYVQEFINSKNPQEAEKIRLLSEAEIDKKMNLKKTNYIQKVEKEAASSLINNASWIITGLIFFIIHWYCIKNHLKAFKLSLLILNLLLFLTFGSFEPSKAGNALS